MNDSHISLTAVLVRVILLHVSYGPNKVDEIVRLGSLPPTREGGEWFCPPSEYVGGGCVRPISLTYTERQGGGVLADQPNTVLLP